MTDMVNEAIQGDAGKQPDSGSEMPGVITVSTANRQCTLQIRALPLPPKVTDLLLQNAALVKTVNKLLSAGSTSEKANEQLQIGEHAMTELRHFKAKLAEVLGQEDGRMWGNAVDRMWALSRTGTCVLLNGIEGYDRLSMWSNLESPAITEGRYLRDFDNAVVTGFQIATQSGPLCQEPMMGVCFVIDRWDIQDADRTKDADVNEVNGCVVALI